jgi:hypothetical protein
MKLKFTFILSFIFLSLQAYSDNNIFDNFDYYRITANYNGSAYNGSSILVYGDAGVFTISSDGGRNWRHVFIDDSLNIMSVTNIGKVYYGVTNKNYIIQSNDEGNSWQKYFIENNNFYKILTYNDNLFCLSENSIIEFNQNIQKIKEYPITNDTSLFDFAIADNNIFYINGKGKINKINLLNDDITNYNMKDLGMCTECAIPSNLFSAGNILYFKLDSILYSLNGSVFVPIYNTSQPKSLFTTHNGELFEFYNINNDSLNLDYLYFNRLDTSSKAGIRIIYDYYDRYISALVFKSLNFLSNDTIIAVGRDKLIYMSYDRGVSWQLKSHFNPLDFWRTISRLNEKEAFCVARGVKFINTTDGGVTWLPQKNYMNYFSKERFKYYFYITAYHSCNATHKFAYYYTDAQNDTNFAYTDDGGETVKMRNVNDVIGYANKVLYQVYSNNNQLLFTQSSQVKYEVFTMIFNLSYDLTYNNKSYIDSACMYLFDKYDNKLIAIMLNYKYPNTFKKNWDSIYLSLVSSIDNGLTWKTEVDLKSIFIDNNMNVIKVLRIQDNIFLCTYNSIDSSTYYNKLNINTLQLINIFKFKGRSSGLIGCAGFGSKLFIDGYFDKNHKNKSDLLEFDDIENPPFNYISVLPTKRYWSFDMNIFNDSLFILSANDSLTHWYTMWFAKPKTNATVVKESQIKTNNSLYLSTPSPLPGNELIRVKLYWDQRLDIEEADFKLFSSMGEEINQNNKFNFDLINNYSGYITWNCKDVNTGVYFINVRLGSHTRSIPVVLVK